MRGDLKHNKLCTNICEPQLPQFSSTYTQWAAVTTQFGWINVAPQATVPLPSFPRRYPIQGQLWGSTSLPPCIMDTARRPHSWMTGATTACWGDAATICQWNRTRVSCCTPWRRLYLRETSLVWETQAGLLGESSHTLEQYWFAGQLNAPFQFWKANSAS